LDRGLPSARTRPRDAPTARAAARRA
jgi:hypothetical protein